MLGDKIELEIDCLSAGDETQQQPNKVVQGGKKWGRPRRQLQVTKRRKLLLSFLQPPSKTKDLIQGNPYSHGMHKKGTEMPAVVPKRKRAWKIQIRSQKEVADMGRLFAQKYIQLYSNFNDIVNYTLSSGFSGSGLIPIGSIPLFPIRAFKMDVTYSLISVNTRGIRENNRRDLVINYCKTLDSDFSILQETHVTFSHLHDIKELSDGEVIISPGKTQTCGVLVIAKRRAPPKEQIITALLEDMFSSKSKIQQILS